MNECADPGECAEVLADVWLFLDNEMDGSRRAVVQKHLDDCSPCLAEAGLDAKLKLLLQNKCGGDRAPSQLRERLFAQLQQTVVVADGDGAVTSVRTTSITVEG